MRQQLKFNVELSDTPWLKDESALNEKLEEVLLRVAEEGCFRYVNNAAGFLPQLAPVHHRRMLHLRDELYANLPGGEKFGVDADESVATGEGRGDQEPD